MYVLEQGGCTFGVGWHASSTLAVAARVPPKVCPHKQSNSKRMHETTDNTPHGFSQFAQIFTRFACGHESRFRQLTVGDVMSVHGHSARALRAEAAAEVEAADKKAADAEAAKKKAAKEAITGTEQNVLQNVLVAPCGGTLTGVERGVLKRNPTFREIVGTLWSAERNDTAAHSGVEWPWTSRKAGLVPSHSVMC